ncbi:39S ribosomal protein L40, mitochondrial [Condylostylus longicornis]|uniref:39S ribosomal protein L40, mitochondrial n=1 Tax=Condylostylus longicornis TaxID=2530218 RepID=UPI00244E4D81|nr:39S ribosomal protein L40, mitochondrial [Condylostylus longicornis]
MLSLLTRLNSMVIAKNVRHICTTNYNFLQVTSVLMAEPLKKKKKLDPMIIKQREERKKKKLEKQIRRLERNARQLKPVDELEVPLELLDEKKMRARIINPITEEEKDRRILLEKKWARYKLETRVSDFKFIDSLHEMQEFALEELRKESEELYQEAIKPDLSLVPFSFTGPVATPPIDNYDSPDGEYIDVTKKWE